MSFLSQCTHYSKNNGHQSAFWIHLYSRKSFTYALGVCFYVIIIGFLHHLRDYILIMFYPLVLTHKTDYNTQPKLDKVFSLLAETFMRLKQICTGKLCRKPLRTQLCVFPFDVIRCNHRIKMPIGSDEQLCLSLRKHHQCCSVLWEVNNKLSRMSTDYFLMCTTIIIKKKSSSQISWMGSVSVAMASVCQDKAGKIFSVCPV